MTALLTLDLGKTCGWAFGPIASPVPRCGVWPLPPRDKRDVLAARLAALRTAFCTALHEWRPDLVVVAEPFRSRSSGEAAYKGGMTGLVREECWVRHIRYSAQPEGTVRKALLGRGMGPTEQMKALALAWCEQAGIPVPAHDAADSVVLWAWCRAELIQTPLLGLGRAGKRPKQPELTEGFT